MKDCAAAELENAPLDPKKLPNYVFGMVLGPADFRQVLEHFEWKHRNENLLLHGSGTMCGLRVSARPLPGATDVQITVAAGFAISPRGRLIRVDTDQCAQLNTWLQAQAGAPYGSPGPGAHRVYVTLCYRQCLTDLVPIAGQQCAPDADNRAPSRILESYAVQFAWTPPAQPLEERARLFAALMRRVEVMDPAGSLPGVDDAPVLFAAVRALASDPLPLPGSLPDLQPIRLASTDAETAVREALTIWVTEVCPAICPKAEASPLLESAADDCLLLAAIDFTIANNGQLSVPVDSFGQLVAGAIGIDETHRPILVPTRLLQELFTVGSSGGPGGQSELTGTVTLVPGGNWPQFTTLQATLPATISPDAAIELSVESSTPALLGNTPATTGNLALTLHRPVQGSLPAPPRIAATYLSTAPALTSVTVRWRAYQG